MMIVASVLTAAAVLFVVTLVIVARVAPYGRIVFVDRAEAARLREARRASTRTTA
jgi:hypothetical protein